MHNYLAHLSINEKPKKKKKNGKHAFTLWGRCLHHGARWIATAAEYPYQSKQFSKQLTCKIGL